ncbi:MAG: FAD-dependent oxidoreductase, partial [Clostridia bacterium]|nr:FAD-dependent oxidoreductase [Clostridia bacterium]
MIFDVAIIGAGVIGGLIARELSFYDKSVVLLEKCNDVAMGSTKANSAIVHGGFDAKTGTLKAKMNVLGAKMMPAVTKELGVPYKQNGSLVVAFSEGDLETLKNLYQRGLDNGVEGLSLIDFDELKRLEPNISDSAKGALLCKSAGIVCPYELTIAAVENAIVNGVVLKRNFEVREIRNKGGVFSVFSDNEEVQASLIINCAGVASGKIAEMIGDCSISICPRKGEYYVMDKSEGNLVSHTVFQCPGPLGKGILVTPTVDGNLLVGPTALDVDDPYDTSTTSAGLSAVIAGATKSVPAVSTRSAITQFSGVRSHPVTDDFIIGKSSVNDRFINVAGIESPGLSSAPAIALYVREIVDGVIH